MPASYRLEPEYADAYGAWQKDRSPANTSVLLDQLQPALESTVRTHLGAADPLAMSRARQMAVRSLPSYDPYKASLRTHLYGQLQGLKRWSGRQSAAVRIPERVAYDRQALDRYERELEHTLGRSPTDDEIADHYGFSPRRLARVRQFAPPVAEGTLERASGQVFGGVAGGEGHLDDLWLQVVRDQLHPTDQQILDWTLKDVPNSRIATRLRLSPGAISQRKAKIEAMLRQREELLL